MAKTRLFVILLTLCAYAAQSARITGFFKNARPGDRVELFVPHYYVDGHSDTYWVQLDQQLAFSLEAPLPEPQLAFLVFNFNHLPVFLEPNDTLTIEADAFRFLQPLALGGRAGANNRLLQQFFKENPPDYDEMNNLRLKIGHWWAAVEPPMYERMENLAPTEFKAFLDARKSANMAMLKDFSATLPGALTPAFVEWLSAEITYSWAYHLLFYGHVFAKRHSVQPEFFDFLYEAPNFCKAIGSDWYRQFLQAIIAWHLAKDEQTDNFYAGQYALAGEMLRDKPLAFFRSEMIRLAFSGERYREILPFYTDFVKTNPYPAFEAKVTDLYEKVARVSPGLPAPMFTASDAKGNEVSLAQMRGRVVYLNFWASWCGTCLEKMAKFDHYAAELERLGIEIVNISIDENSSKWRSALTERGFKGRNLLASAGSGLNIAAAYGVEAIPQYFIIGKNGYFADKAPTSQPEAIKNQLLVLSKTY
ncbi:MAG: redoxin family protein [Saprospiraceae bacterium]|nr:redoxin family protein [Saprospiraceae bacterium]